MEPIERRIGARHESRSIDRGIRIWKTKEPPLRVRYRTCYIPAYIAGPARLGTSGNQRLRNLAEWKELRSNVL